MCCGCEWVHALLLDDIAGACTEGGCCGVIISSGGSSFILASSSSSNVFISSVGGVWIVALIGAVSQCVR